MPRSSPTCRGSGTRTVFPWRALNRWRPTYRPRTLVTDEGTRSEARVFTVVLAGEPVLGKNVALLATMLDDRPLAQRLKRGLAQRNSIVTRDADRAAERSALGLGWAPKHAPPTTADAATAPAELLNRL